MWFVDTVEIQDFMSLSKARIKFPTGVKTVILGKRIDDDGSNGVGKSAILEAITWCIFGKTIRGFAAIKDVIRRGEKKTTVKVTLKHNKRKVTVIRTRTSSGQTSMNYFEGEATDMPGTNKMVESELHRLLGFDFNYWISSVMFASRPDVRRFLEQTPSSRAEMLNRIFDFAWVDKFIEKIKAKAQSKSERAEAASHKVDAARSSLVSVKSRLAAAIEHNRSVQSVSKDRISDIKQQIEQAQNQIKSDNEIIEEDQAEFDRQIENYEQVIGVLQTEIEQEHADQDRLEREFIMDKERHRSKVAELEQIKKSKTCPTCGQTVKSEKIETGEIEKEIRKLATKIDAGVTSVQMMSNSIKQKQKKIDQINKPVPGERLSRYIERRDAAKRKLIQLKATLDETMKAAEVHRIPVKPIKAKLKKVRQLLAKRKKIRDKRQRTADKYAKVMQILRGSDVRHFMLRRINRSIATKIQKYARKLFVDRVTVTYDDESDRYMCDIENCASTYEAMSTGQRARMDVASVFAIRDMLSKSRTAVSTMFIDELFDGVDDVGIDRLMSMLSDNLSVNSPVIVSHRDSIRTYADKVIEVRNDGKSSIVDDFS